MQVQARPKKIGGKKPLSFAIIFLVVAIVEYLIFYEFAPKFLVDGLIEATAFIVFSIVKATGALVRLSGMTIEFSRMNLEIVYECTGGFAMFIFSACVIAFPSSVKQKIWGHVLGIFGIFFINLGRLLVLSWSVIHKPSAFNFIHKYLWHATFILLVLILWILWVNVVSGGKERKDSHPEKKKKK